VRIRPALARDAGAACDVLRRSIGELCARDHHDDPALKQAWLANKTPATVRRWITAPGGQVLLAEMDGKVVGVGAATARGEITLNYVAPEARFRGVSKAVLAALEAWLVGQGVARASLSSTETAHAFYLAAGYCDAADLRVSQAVDGQPMIKALG